MTVRGEGEGERWRGGEVERWRVGGPAHWGGTSDYSTQALFPRERGREEPFQAPRS